MKLSKVILAIILVLILVAATKEMKGIYDRAKIVERIGRKMTLTASDIGERKFTDEEKIKIKLNELITAIRGQNVYKLAGLYQNCPEQIYSMLIFNTKNYFSITNSKKNTILFEENIKGYTSTSDLLFQDQIITFENDSIATVQGNTSFWSEKNLSSNFKIIFRKENNSWDIIDIRNLLPQMKLQKNDMTLMSKANNFPENVQSSYVNIPNLLKFESDGFITKEDVVSQYGGNILIQPIDEENVFQYPSNIQAAFLLDRITGIMHYGKIILNDPTNYAKEFASGTTSLGKLNNPSALAADILGYVYIADTDNNRIIKLHYNASSNVIDSYSVLTTDVKGPLDVDVQQGWDYTSNSDDVVYIADTGNDRILVINANTGAKIKEIHSYTDDITQTTVEIFQPRSISVVRDFSYQRIYFIHGYSGNYILTHLKAASSSWSSIWNKVTVFNLPSINPSKVTVSPTNLTYGADQMCIWVVDSAQGMVHKYSNWLEYLGSYGQLGKGVPPLLHYPILLNFSHQNNPIAWPYVYRNVLERYDYGAGYKYFTPTVNIIDLKVNSNISSEGTLFTFFWKYTECASFFSEPGEGTYLNVKDSRDEIIFTEDITNDYLPGTHSWTWQPDPSIPSGRYSIEITTTDWFVDYPSGTIVTATLPFYYNKTGNGTLSGNVTLTQNLTVNPGEQLTILPGTTIKFDPGVSMIIQGKLIAQGNLGQKIIFEPSNSSLTTPGSWGSISFQNEGAQGSILDNAVVKYGTEIQVINTHTIVIKNSDIISTINGINLSGSVYCGVNSNKILNPRDHGIIIQNNSHVNLGCNMNSITKTNKSGAAILFSGGSDGPAWQNSISGFNWGIASIWGSSAYMGYGSNMGKNNVIKNCLYGIKAYQSSYCYAGILVEDPDGWYDPYLDPWLTGNSIYSNSPYNGQVYSSSSVYAQGVYWGGTPQPSMFSIGTGSIFLYDLWIGDPWLTSSNSIISEAEYLSNNSKESNVIVKSKAKKSIGHGVKLRQENRLIEAKDFFINYLIQYPDEQSAYVELYNCFDDETKPELIKYFSNLSSKASKEHQLLLASLYLKSGDIVSAKEINNRLSLKYQNSELGVRATLNTFYIKLYNENDPDGASVLLDNIKQKNKYSSPMEISLAIHNLENYVGSGSNQRFKIKNQLSKVSDNSTLPTRFELSQNYPNPFNPTTIITYQIPEPTTIKILVFDNTGREVITLVNDYKQAGVYRTEFNASMLSSGVYFYRMTTPKYVSTQKMLFVK